MKNVFSLAAIVAVLFAAMACGGSNTPPPAGYAGSWTGADGTFIAIRADGSGDYKSGNSHITGGSAVIDEGAKTLKISFAGMGPTFTIDKPPAGDQMTLSGVVFKKGGAPSSTTTSNALANNQNSNKSDDDQ